MYFVVAFDCLTAFKNIVRLLRCSCLYRRKKRQEREEEKVISPSSLCSYSIGSPPCRTGPIGTKKKKEKRKAEEEEGGDTFLSLRPPSSSFQRPLPLIAVFCPGVDCCVPPPSRLAGWLPGTLNFSNLIKYQKTSERKVSKGVPLLTCRLFAAPRPRAAR